MDVIYIKIALHELQEALRATNITFRGMKLCQQASPMLQCQNYSTTQPSHKTVFLKVTLSLHIYILIVLVIFFG